MQTAIPTPNLTLHDSAEAIDMVGDLSSLPSPDRRLWDEEIWALDRLLLLGTPSPQEVSIFRDIIADRRSLLEVELREGTFLTQVLADAVHFQLRARTDQRQGDWAIEQWVPAVRCWLVCARFPRDTPASEMVDQLRKGDPRYQTPSEALQETRAIASANRAARDAEGSAKVEAAVDSLSSRALETFMEVEEALKTGESIFAHGDDARQIESLVQKTRSAASHGDVEAQSVLVRGQRDNSLCINPGDNPLNR